MRTFNFIDQMLCELDASLRTVYSDVRLGERSTPTFENMDSNDVMLSDEEQKLSARLLRVNHAGEIAAQGLYRGQALTAKNTAISDQMKQSAKEENDHLDWCEERIEQLNSHTSYFAPLWYWGAFSIGAATGTIGDQWSLGFVKETEDQVVKHLDKHLTRLPKKDVESRTILKTMKEDEQHHSDMALQAGARKLPWLVRKVLMPTHAKVMTKTAYWV